MPRSSRQNLIGVTALLLLLINSLFWPPLLILAALLKLVIRARFARPYVDKILIGISNNWIACNNLALQITRKINWHITGLKGLRKDRWYLVISNHQSWTDIPVLQKVFLRKIPFLRFFIKKELMWVPLLNLAWWALDYPFLNRYTSAFVAKNPHLRGKDIEITRKACAKFKEIPVSIMTFVEGTLFTPEKAKRLKSPYVNLLKPKTGGIAFTLSAMGPLFSSILNVTITYPGGPYSFWDFLCGRVRRINVDVEELSLSKDLIGDYDNDPHHRQKIKNWLNHLWTEKDKKLQKLHNP